MVDFNEVGISLFVHQFDHSPARLKSMFLALEEGFLRLGITPTRMAALRHGVKSNGKYATYRGLRPRLMKSDFSDLQTLSFECLRADRSKIAFRQWSALASAGQERQLRLSPEEAASWNAIWGTLTPSNARWRANWNIFPQDTGVAEDAALNELIRFASMSMDTYGYITWLRRGTEPEVFDFGVGFPGDEIGHSWSHRLDQIMNRMTWTRFACWTQRLLRDVYPMNFLGRTYLNLPIDGGTLEKWILADPLRRGSLEPLNGRVWIWRPALKWLPFIREPLFRAGILHWWRMFCVDDVSRLQVTKPFTPPAETPEMFRPEYYHGRDPKVTG